MNENAPVRALDLDACAAEPIRVPGAIQPHGALLVVDPAGERVLQVSANLEDFSGLAVTPGQRLEEVAGLEALAAELQRASPEGVDSLRVLEVGARPPPAPAGCPPPRGSPAEARRPAPPGRRPPPAAGPASPQGR